MNAWLVIAAALIGANWTFLTERWFAVGPAPVAGKPFWGRLIELGVSYAIVGGIAFALENHEGNVAPQGWEFFAVTACVFLVMAYPGFVYRYLRRTKRGPKHGT